MATLSLFAKVDSTDYGALGSGSTSESHIREITFGPRYGAAGPNHFDVRNILVGTAGYGSSDLWAPALSGLGDFDSFHGPGADPTFSGGVMSFNNVGDRVGIHDLGAEYNDVYVQFDLFVHLDDNDPDYHDIGEAGDAVA